jgi:hypothetical protein
MIFKNHQMRKLLFGLVLLLFINCVANAQQKHPVEKKVPLKVETLPVKPGYKFNKTVVTPLKPVQQARPISTLRSIPGMARERAILPAGLKIKDRNGRSAALPDQFIYRKSVANTQTQRTTNSCNDLLLTRQSQIDSFPILYPDCDEFDNVIIDGENASPQITNFDSLKYLSVINHDLDIRNTNVINLNPLNNITKIGSYFYLTNNLDMQTLGLFNMWELGGVVFVNQPNLHELNDLFGSLNNPSLWSVLLINLGLNDLTSLTDVNSIINIAVIGCYNITSLNGMENLTSLNGGIQLVSNQQLSDLSQLSGIQTIDNGSLQIMSSPPSMILTQILLSPMR